MKELEHLLREFVETNNITTKGPLCVVLVVTRLAQKQVFPLQENQFLAKSGGQVRGLGKGAVQKILSEHGINRVLAEEGGRTSRGSINNMNQYIEFLNEILQHGQLNWSAIEEFWIDRIKEFFSSTPLKIKLDQSKSLRAIIRELLGAALKRQSENAGTMYAGAVMQHLVGAKLKIALPNESFETHGFSVADQQSGRKGDFLIGSSAIHVTTAPTEALIRKCQDNLNQSLKPIIITTTNGSGGANALADNYGLADRIDVFEIEQFIATNVFELGSFVTSKLNVTIRDIVRVYNEIVESCETDPSLKIEFS